MSICAAAVYPYILLFLIIDRIRRLLRELFWIQKKMMQKQEEKRKAKA